METIAHPFRLTCGNVDKNLSEFEEAIKNYTDSGFDIIGASEAIKILEQNEAFLDMGDLILMNQEQQFNLQNIKHSADLNRVEVNTTEYVRSMELHK